MAKSSNKRRVWSYSQWSKYRKCPAQFKGVHIDKIRGPSSKAGQRGELIHAKMESYLKGMIPRVPKELAPVRSSLEMLRKQKATAERQIFMDENMCPIDGLKGWEGYRHPMAWCTAKIDADLPVTSKRDGLVVDLKTGQRYDDHAEQGELYALPLWWEWLRGEGAKSTSVVGQPAVEVEFWYVDQPDVIDRYRYDADELSDLLTKWIRRGLEMERARRFPAKPGPHCRWCHLRSDQMGSCTAWKRA